MLTTCAASWTCGSASCQVVSASIPNSARIAESAKRRMQAQARTEARKLTDDAVMSLRVSRTRPVHKRVAWCRSWRARRKSLAGPALMEIVDDERLLPRLAVIAAQMGMIGREIRMVMVHRIGIDAGPKPQGSQGSDGRHRRHWATPHPPPTTVTHNTHQGKANHTH